MADELIDLDPLLKASWGVASHYITKRITLVQFEQMATSLNEGKSIDQALRDIPSLIQFQKTAKLRWVIHALKGAFRHLNKTPEFTAYRTALFEGTNVPLVDWVRSQQGKAQDRMAALLDSEDESIAIRASDNILKQVEKLEGVSDARDGPSDTARNTAAVVQILVQQLESGNRSGEPASEPDGGTVVDIEPAPRRVGRPGSSALPAESGGVEDAPESGEGKARRRRGEGRQE